MSRIETRDARRETRVRQSALFRFRGAVGGLAAAERDELFDRTTSSDEGVRARTAEIIARVRREGDAALVALARELDGVRLESLEVDRRRCRAALDALEPSLRRAMERAAANITTAHRAWMPQPTEVETESGVIVGRRPDPLDSVGVYAPGGRAAYPSSVLMGVIPARVAGVARVVACSPPGPAGLPSAVVLAAAELAGAHQVYAIGGAGAIAAMAYGTESVRRVSRIVGPGNAYVAEAKLQVSDAVAIDSPAGPSELLVIADASVEPALVAREVVAQAEHDPRAAVVIVAEGEALAQRLEEAVRSAAEGAERREIVLESLAGRGALLWASSVGEAVEFANLYAPEHLLLAVAEPGAAFRDVRNAGTVFLDETSSVAFGDYMTGANHVLPTGGLARSYSGLSTLDFVRWTTYQRVDRSAARRLSDDVGTFADAEGLPGHAAAARAWRDAGLGTRVSGLGHGSWRGSLSPASSAESRDHPPASGHPPESRESYRTISLYAPDRTPCAIDLSDNTNLWGVPPSAARAVREAATATLTRYPAVYAGDLKAALAAYAGVRREEVVTGCGSDDVLDSAIRAFAEPGERVAFPEPSFAMIPLFAKMNGVRGVGVPLTASFDIDADALVATGARIVYICSPNNPTGTAASRAAIERVVERAPGLVILDEAYAEFMGGGFLSEAPRTERLLVVRTLSKAFGLAGLRIGYATGSAAVVAEVEKSRGPYKVNAVGERAAVAALREDMDWVGAQIAEVRANRARFAEALERLGLAPLPSAANFVLVRVSNAADVAQRMRRSGVAVRPFAALPGVGDALRITIGPWPMMQAALAALEEALACA